MKYFLPTILLCLFIGEITFGQTVFYPRIVPTPSIIGYDRYQFDDNYSALQSQLPYEFRFLINDDHISTLSNSAKTAFADGNQVYASIDPASDDNFRVSALLKQQWLVGLTFYSNYSDYENSGTQSSSFDIDQTSGSLRTLRQGTDSTSSFRINEYPESRVELRLAKVLRSSENSAKSLGVRIAWWQDSFTEDYTSSDMRQDIYERYENGLIERRDIDLRTYNTDNAYKTDNNTLIIGIEYSSVTEISEFTHSLTAQFANGDYFRGEKRERIDDNSRENFDYNPDVVTTDISRSISVLNRLDRTDRSPVLFGYEGYLNRNINWLGNDYLFIGVSGFYSFGESTLSESYSTIDTQLLPDTTVQENSYSLDPTKDEEWAAFGRISAGYAIQLHSDELSFYTGFNPFFEYAKSNTYSTSDALINNILTEYRVSGIIPLYAEYNLNSFLSLTGGGILTFSYTNTVQSNRITDPFDFVNNNGRDSYDSKEETESFRQDQRTFFGFKASHESGLRLAADIRGDLTRFSGWFFTLGYTF